MKICKEMKKLREWLDEHNIEWKDMSDVNIGFWI